MRFGLNSLNFTQQRAIHIHVCIQLLCGAVAWKYLRLHVHIPVSGDILRLSWKDVILSAAGVSAAAKDTGGVGGTRPRFWKRQRWSMIKVSANNKKETSWKDDAYQVRYKVSVQSKWLLSWGQLISIQRIHLIPMISLFTAVWFMIQLLKANWRIY